ncbi:MAG: RNA-binding protein [Clostridia bacterium]
MDVYPGQIVYSTAGRDKGKHFIVMEVIDDHYAYLCDGDIRRVEKPKKKKIKHLLSAGRDDQQIREKLTKQQKVTNAELRRCLRDQLEQ